MNWGSNRSLSNRVPSTYQALIHWLRLAYQVVTLLWAEYNQTLAKGFDY